TASRASVDLRRWHTTAVERDEFWSIVEQARADAAESHSGWPSGDAIGAALTDRLAQLPLQRVLEFDGCYYPVVGRADQWEFCAAAWVICGYLSDDFFTDFKAGLVGLGRETYERVVADPDTLAEHPLVQAIARGQADRLTLPGEAIGIAAPDAYER